MQYALVGPDDVVSRVEPATRIDPTVMTRSGWRWLPVVDGPQPTANGPLTSATEALVVNGDAVQRTWVAVTRQATSYDVNVERDRRLQTVTFAGKVYDFDGTSQVNISGAGVLAVAAIINGVQPGNLRWANPNRDFVWVAADNSTVAMDAQTCFAFAQAAAQWKASHILAARAIKDLNPIPADYAANARWPS